MGVGAVLQPETGFQYPAAEASQEEVTNNPELFNATLKKVHLASHAALHVSLPLGRAVSCCPGTGE